MRMKEGNKKIYIQKQAAWQQMHHMWKQLTDAHMGYVPSEWACLVMTVVSESKPDYIAHLVLSRANEAH